MANVKWNAQQQQAIDARNGTILVSAAAGSGKTAVLVERVIQMLTDKSANIKADQLLIVTFTNLAAEEMRIRINKRITQLLDQCTVDSNLDEEYLRNQQLLLERAHISTIDSFCKDIVKTAYTRFDISPDYRIGDNSELKALQCNAVEEVAQEYYLREDFKNIASLFTTSTNDNELKRSVINFYSFLSALPFPERWTEQTLSELKASEKDVIHSKWINNIVSDSINQIDYISGLMHNNTELFIKMDSLDEVSQDNSFSQTDFCRCRL
jgi:ATP-dependent helicase/nuclease subunit A